MDEKKAKADEHKAVGNTAMKEKRYQDAIEQYSKGLEIDSENHVLYSNRSAAYAKNEQYAEALDDAEEVIRIQPTWSRGYSRKGSALQFLGRYDEAKIAFEEGLKYDPDSEILKTGLKECESELTGPATSQPLGNPFVNLDTILPRLREDHRTKDYVDEPSYMAMLRDLGEDPLRLSNYLKDDRLRLTLSALLGFDLQKPEEMTEDGMADVPSESELRAGQTSEPEDEEPQIQELDPNKALQEKNLGNEFYKSKDYPKALKHYQRAIRYDPSNITFYTNQAAVYLEMGRCKECRDVCFKAVEVGKQNMADNEQIAKAYARIGKSFMKESDYNSAVEYLNKSLDEHKIEDTLNRLHECRQQIGDGEREQ